jgi:hypothetical protein
MLSSDRIFARFPSMNKLIVLMTYCESNNKKSQKPLPLALPNPTDDETRISSSVCAHDKLFGFEDLRSPSGSAGS